MKLATYQPLIRNANNRNGDSINLFANYLGFEPVFCFPADTAEQFLFGCFYSFPALPERLITLDTDNYKAFDLVKWGRIISNEDLNIDDIVPLFNDVRPKYAEFIVPESELDSAIYNVPVNNILSECIDSCNEDEQLLKEQLQKMKVWLDNNMEMNDKSDPNWDKCKRAAWEETMLESVLGYFLYRCAFHDIVRVPFDIIPVTPMLENQLYLQQSYNKMDTLLANMYKDESQFTYENFIVNDLNKFTLTNIQSCDTLFCRGALHEQTQI